MMLLNSAVQFYALFHRSIQMIKRIIPLILSIVLSAGITAGADSIDITQMDNRSLLLDGTMDVYFLYRGADGSPAEIDNSEKLSLFKAAEDGTREELSIKAVEQEAPRLQGISFLLLIDNSGSMHEEKLGGKPRYETAVYAVDQFLQEIDNPNDRVGIASFNTYYSKLSDVNTMSDEHTIALGSIQTPGQEESYTELYRSIVLAGQQLAPFGGRRAIIVLSDGENYPYINSGKSHPVYGNETVEPDAVSKELTEEGITLYAVHIGRNHDRQLDNLAAASGGRSFSADNQEILKDIYSLIRDEIRKEYRVSFSAPYVKDEVTRVSLAYDNLDTEAVYFTPHFLADPATSFQPLILIAIAIAAGIILILLLMAWEKPVSGAELSQLPRGRNFSPSTRVSLTQDVTVIGSGNNDDMTIAGNPGLKTRHATVNYDKQEGTYTLISDNEFRVNNKLKRQHRLRSGDVIDLEGTTIVFDKPMEDSKDKKS